MKGTKIVGLLLCLAVLLGTVLTGCGQKSAYEGEVVLDYYLGEEPQTMDPQQMWGEPELFVNNMISEGLVRSGKDDGSVVAGVAKKWTFDKATNTWTFNLRDDVKWHDGTPITADDFIFAWRLVMDESGPYYNFVSEYIEGAEEYAAYPLSAFAEEKISGFADMDEEEQASAIDKMSDELKKEFKEKKDELWSKVGVAVKDEGKTIQIKLARPAPYFLDLVAFACYAPVNEAFYNEHKAKGDYTLEASGLASNGPWYMKEWKHDDYMVLARNENYWNKKNVQIDTINLKMVNDIETRTNLLKTGKLDGSAIQASDLKDFQDQAVLDEYNLQTLEDKSDYSVFYVEVNHFNNEITKNANIRKALAYSMDRKSFVETVNIGDSPALAVIPYQFPGLKKTFREENGKTMFEDNQKEQAKEFLKAGLKELKLDKLPELPMLIGASDIARTIAEKFQADWKEIGIDVKIVPLTWGERLTRLQKGDFAMSNSGWGPDFADAMTYLDLFVTDGPNNSGKYSNPEYDDLINKAKNEWDEKKRAQYMYDAEKILIDDMVIIPQYFRIGHRTYKKYLTGVVIKGIGATVDFYWAKIDMNKKLEDQAKY